LFFAKQNVKKTTFWPRKMQGQMELFCGGPAFALQLKEKITKGVKVSIKNGVPLNLKSPSSRSSARPGLYGKIRIVLGVPWLDGNLHFI
jgi:hypothetical protein